MDIWIAVAAVGGVLCLVGLAAAVRQFARGQLRLRELILLLVVIAVAIAAVIGEVISGRRLLGGSEVVLWLLIATALFANARRRRGRSRDDRQPKVT